MAHLFPDLPNRVEHGENRHEPPRIVRSEANPPKTVTRPFKSSDREGMLAYLRTLHQQPFPPELHEEPKAHVKMETRRNSMW